MPAIRVEYQHQWVKGALTLLPPKYESYRTLVVPPFLAELLELVQESHSRPWIFPSITGQELAKANPSYQYWRKFADGHPAQTSTLSRHRTPELPPVEAYRKKRSYLLRHGGKEWLDEDGHSRIAVETRMGHEVAGVEGLYSNLTPTMERKIARTLQVRWHRFVLTLEEDWMRPSPTHLPVDLAGWINRQVSEAQAAES